MQNLIVTTEPPPPVIDPVPDELFSDSRSNDKAQDFEFLCRLLGVSEIDYFDLPMLARLCRLPYHAVTLEGPFDVAKLQSDLRDKVVRSETSINRSGHAKMYRLLLELGSGVFATFLHDHFKVFAPTPQAAEAAAANFRRYVKPQGPGEAHFYVVSLTGHGPSTVAVPIERVSPITNEDVALNYGADFPTWEQQWLDKLRRSPSGLTILLGKPGTGKTSYARGLMTRLINKAVFFHIPVSAADILANPGFVNFWTEQTQLHGSKRKIALLEDAEELLLPRTGGCCEKVSNLLNIADGFLGDYLKLHVIVTSNAELRQLDPALLRPGRLAGSREFRRLTRPEAEKIAATKGLTLPEQEDYSLAEIYCGTVDAPVLDAPCQIGFAQ